MAEIKKQCDKSRGNGFPLLSTVDVAGLGWRREVEEQRASRTSSLARRLARRLASWRLSAIFPPTRQRSAACCCVINQATAVRGARDMMTHWKDNICRQQSTTLYPTTNNISYAAMKTQLILAATMACTAGAFSVSVSKYLVGRISWMCGGFELMLSHSAPQVGGVANSKIL